MDRSKTLAVLPSLPVRMTPTGQVALTRKFVDGMQEYLGLWDGPITAFMEPTHTATNNLDEVEFNPGDLPFRLEVVSFLDETLGEKLAGHQVALGTLGHRQVHLAKLCRSIGLPCLYVAEYSLKTRFQIIHSNPGTFFKALKRHVWEYNQELLYRRAIRLASGVQCNGTPTFESYRKISPSPLLYFDTRVSESMLITPDELEGRGKALLAGEPLRLLFSGRFIGMKGTDHLVGVADHLRKLEVPFHMTICGDGVLAASMKADIARLGLGDLVSMPGTLDFKDELLPFAKANADLFVCCHRTGDPACTYLETMSCGVPIVGYDNEAFRGVVRESEVGWITPMNRPEKVAEQIAVINRDRPGLLAASRRALEFGHRHTFDRTFKARIEHLKSCSEPARVHSFAT